jgi:hypothetical protein
MFVGIANENLYENCSDASKLGNNAGVENSFSDEIGEMERHEQCESNAPEKYNAEGK